MRNHGNASNVRILWPMDSEFAALIVRQKCEKLIADHPELAGIITEELEGRIIDRLQFLCCRLDDQCPSYRERLPPSCFG